jgi:prepilin-type N-terminal cleavage/methylation domain-containing protein
MQRSITPAPDQASSRRGFTIVELLIVIAVIGILTTISIMSFGKYQATARDSQRSAKAAVIAEALEKYYDHNGEYPSCSAITQAASTIDTSVLPGLDAQALLTPKATTGDTNSVKCTDITTTTADIFSYVGDGSQACSGNVSCQFFTLQYRSEVNQQIVSIKSRHAAAVIVIDAPSSPTVTLSSSGTNLTGTANQVTCMTGIPEYALHTRVHDGTWADYSAWSSTQSVQTIATAQGSKYDFQAKARCRLDVVYSVEVAGAIVSQVAAITTAPSPPTVSLGTSTSTATTWSWTTSSCPSGLTAQFRYAWARDDSTDWRAYSGAITTSFQSVTTSDQGYNYQLKAQQSCKSAYTSGPYSGDSNAVAYLRAVDAPAVATNFQVNSTIVQDQNGNSHQHLTIWWSEPACGAGTVPRLNFYIGAIDQVTVPGTTMSISAGTDLWNDINNLAAHWSSSNPASGLTSYYSSASGASNSDVQNAGGGYLGSTSWLTWRITSSATYEVGDAGGGNAVNAATRFLLYRGYVRYACINTTTNRLTVGGYTFSPAWTWSGV